MKKITFALCLAAFAATLALAPARSSAAPPPNAAQMKALDYLIGVWNCSWSAGAQSGSNVTTYTSVMNGAWLQATETVRTKSGALFVLSNHFTGYDPAEKRYVHVGPDAGGGYELAYTTDLVTFHTQVPAGQPDATFTKVSDVEYSLRAPLMQGGQAMVWQNTCKKAP